jgi:bifunctional non-homologous end joining protein LigD
VITVGPASSFSLLAEESQLKSSRRLANTAKMSSLKEYWKKRPEGKSSEPRGGKPTGKQNSFVVQRHDATRLHYDFRLEMGGVLKSWAVPKGPSLDPSVKRLAIQTEDHPLDYGGFEGTIPEGNYGAGEVILWDRGTYEPVGHVPAEEQVARGEIKFTLHGTKLNGGFVLVRLKTANSKKEWLMIKHRDDQVRTDWNIEEHGKSVKSGKPPGPPRHATRRKAKAAASAASKINVRDLVNAREAKTPDDLRPALASLSDKPFSSDDWLFEIKWDGIRALARIADGQTKLIARSGRDISPEYPEFANLSSHARVRRAVLDGEIVVLDEQGRSDFQRLQARFGVLRPPEKLQADTPVTYYFFDVLYCEGFDVRRAPLAERKKLLEKILITDDRVRISDHIVGKGLELFQEAERKGLEGLIAKRLDSAYPVGRATSWLKFKTVKEVDAVIGGWTDPRGSREFFGSLLVGLYKHQKLHFIGGVGTGFSNELEESIFKKLQELPAPECPFAAIPDTRERAHWVKPQLVARVGYAEWTSEQHLRQPRFLGLQPDRVPRESTFDKEAVRPVTPSAPILSSVSQNKENSERAADPVEKRKSTKSGNGLNEVLKALQKKDQEQLNLTLDGQSVKLTHLNKVYFPDAGFTKRDVLFYYATVSPYILPFLQDRPLVLHRYPNGIGGNAFYQKEAGPSIPDWIRTVDIFSETKRQNVAYFLIDDLASLLYLTNLGCIEHNPFSATSDDLEKPDYMFIDLDPTDGTNFSRVVFAAVAIGKALQQAKLKFFIKTSGATGMHMFIPIVRNYGFDQVRALLEIVTQIAIEQEEKLLTRIFKVQDRPANSVFVDVRQNSYGQSLACVFSLRPRAGAPASTPIAWNELKSDLKPERWNLHSVLKDLPRRSKLWKDFWDHPQTLESALSALQHQHQL